jgi:hypothetical protein
VSSRRCSILRSVALVWGAPALAGLVAFGCSSSTQYAGPAVTTRAPTSMATTTTQMTDVRVTAASFKSLKTMTPVRGFFVANLEGNLKETLAVARSNGGGVYPRGTLLQLVPQEAMVKHRVGWNPKTKDWEFFFLDVSATGTKIVTRGIENVVNRFGGNCASCHSAADAKFDMVCEHDHGCAPLPVGADVIRVIQLADPRPST